MRLIKKNRCTKNSLSVTSSLGVAGLLLAGLCVGFAYWWCDSNCTRVSDEISACEKEMAKLETEFQREAASWDAKKAKDKLRERLTRWGLEMDLAGVDQLVHIDRKGRVRPNLALARINNRALSSGTAVADLGRSASRATRATVSSSRTASTPRKVVSAPARSTTVSTERTASARVVSTTVRRRVATTRH